jgi:hypothetical protein
MSPTLLWSIVILPEKENIVIIVCWCHALLHDRTRCLFLSAETAWWIVFQKWGKKDWCDFYVFWPWGWKWQTCDEFLCDWWVMKTEQCTMWKLWGGHYVVKQICLFPCQNCGGRGEWKLARHQHLIIVIVSITQHVYDATWRGLAYSFVSITDLRCI